MATPRKILTPIALVALGVVGVIVVMGVAVASCTVLVLRESGTRSTARNPDLPALCAIFGPLQEFEGRPSSSIEDRVRLGPRGFRDEEGQAITAVVLLAASTGVEVVGDDAANALARYLLSTRRHHDDPSHPQPEITPDVLAGARLVDAAVQAGRCRGWQGS